MLMVLALFQIFTGPATVTTPPVRVRAPVPPDAVPEPPT